MFDFFSAHDSRGWLLSARRLVTLLVWLVFSSVQGGGILLAAPLEDHHETPVHGGDVGGGEDAGVVGGDVGSGDVGSGDVGDVVVWDAVPLGPSLEQTEVLAPTLPKAKPVAAPVLGRLRHETAQAWTARIVKSPLVRELQPLLGEAAKLTGVDPLLIKALIAVESGFNPQAVSPRGALGLMQIMPHTADRFATSTEKQLSATQRLLDPRTNILTGARVLADLARRLSRLDLVLAAWNAGEGPVRKHKGMPPFDETQRHVVRVLELYRALLIMNLPHGAATGLTPSTTQTP